MSYSMKTTHDTITLKKNNIFDIKIKKSRSNFIYLQMLYILVIFFLRDVFGLPSFITYITDLLMLGAFLLSLGSIQTSVRQSKAKVPALIVVGIFIALLIGSIVNVVNPLYFIWGFRNNFRFFLFWISCIVLLQKKDIDKLLKMFSILFWINILIITIQYFIFGIYGDWLGGIFGNSQGGNTYNNIFCSIIVTYKLSQYFNREISLLNLLVYLISIFYLAALVELKILYFAIILIFVIAILIQRPSFKNFKIIFVGIFAVCVGYGILLIAFPNSAAMLFNLSSLEKYLSGNGYTNAGDLNRFTALSEIQDMFFSKNWVNTLFGFGLGSCDTSNISFLVTPFFEKYEYLHYRWFTHAWVYLEQGAIGLSLLLLFIVSIFVFCFKRRNKALGKYYFMTALFVVTTLIGVIYNCALEMEASYLIAFMLAIPFIISKGNYKRGA